MSVVSSTLIATDSENKQASDIRLWNKVLTHKGRYRDVAHIIVTERRSDIFHLRVNDIDIKLTSDHSVLTKAGWTTVKTLSKLDKIAILNDEFFLEYVDFDLVEKVDEVHECYDFTVLEDHSLCIGGVIIHN